MSEDLMPLNRDKSSLDITRHDERDFESRIAFSTASAVEHQFMAAQRFIKKHSVSANKCIACSSDSSEECIASMMSEGIKDLAALTGNDFHCRTHDLTVSSANKTHRRKMYDYILNLLFGMFPPQTRAVPNCVRDEVEKHFPRGGLQRSVHRVNVDGSHTPGHADRREQLKVVKANEESGIGHDGKTVADSESDDESSCKVAAKIVKIAKAAKDSDSDKPSSIKQSQSKRVSLSPEEESSSKKRMRRGEHHKASAPKESGSNKVPIPSFDLGSLCEKMQERQAAGMRRRNC